MNWIKLPTLPDINMKQPVLIKRDSPFKYGLVYRMETEKDKFQWKFSPEVTEWAYIDQPST